MRTSGRRIAVALVNLYTGTIRAIFMAFGAFAVKRSHCIHTIACNGATTVQLTLVHVLTIEMVARQPETNGTLTIVCARHIDAFVRTIVYLADALVNIAARVVVFGQLVAGFAGAHIRAGRIDANVRAVAVVTDAFVQIDTRAVIGTQLEAHITLAFVASGQILALMRATAILHGTLVHVFTLYLFREVGSRQWEKSDLS